MFKTISNTYYGDGINRGRAVVDMDRNFYASRIDFIYEIDKSDNWKFYYENNNCLTEEEKADLENWFITCG